MQVAEGDTWREITWSQVRVGNVIKLKKFESVPADMIVVSSSDQSGQCWVETKELDGETNLKPKWCVKNGNGCTKSVVKGENILDADCVIETPTEALDGSHGIMIILTLTLTLIGGPRWYLREYDNDRREAARPCRGKELLLERI